jgi:drug/metabolite transporter (DMT)-like permease
MGILLGLATALSWGSSDFLARFASRRIGTLRATGLMQAWGFILLTLFLSATHLWGHLFDGSGWRPWAWGILAGTINTFAMLALYRSFEIGKLSIVAPISASYPVLTVLLSVLTGEILTPLRGFGIAATILGVVLVARGEQASPQAQSGDSGRRASGVPWAFAAAAGFGVLFWLLGVRIMPVTGGLASVWLIRLTGTVLTLGIVLARRSPVLPKGRVATMQTGGMGFLDTGAFVLSNLGMQREQVSVVSVLGSLYGAVTVALAAIVLRERIGRPQWCGMIFIFAGIFLISR